jgi:hypothetical protein
VYGAFGANNDHGRIPERRQEINRQSNGVVYDTPLRDHRWYRFEAGGSGGYDEEESDIWQAVAQYTAGFNPDLQEHTAADFPEPNLRDALETAKIHHEQGFVDNVTRGFWLADLKEDQNPEGMKGWPVEQQAAYYARKGFSTKLLTSGPRIPELVAKMTEIWKKWQQMDGNNPPLVRTTAGPRRDYDINLDGVAHYGMLPDFLQDVRNVGLTPEDLSPLFRSANDYIEMWHTCEQKAPEIAKAIGA